MEIAKTKPFITAQPMQSGELKAKIDIAESYTSMGDHLSYFPPAMVVGAGHDLVNGVTSYDVADEDVVGKLDELGLNNLATYYGKHSEAAKLAGTLASSFIPIIGATKLIRAGNMLDKALSRFGKPGEIAQSILISSGKSANERAALMAKTDFADLAKNRVSSTELVKNQMQAQRVEAGLDMLKESVAAEAVLYGLYYDEKTAKEGTNPFYTDSLTQNLAFAVLPTVAFSGGAYAFTGKKLNNWLAQREASIIAEAINLHHVAVKDALTRPGERGVYIAAQAQVVSGEEGFLKVATTKDARTEAANRLGTARNAVVDQLGEMAKDKYFGPAITPVRKAEGLVKEAETASKAIFADPSAGVGVVGIDSFTHETQTSLKKIVPHEIDRLTKKVSDLNAELDAANAMGLDGLEFAKARDVAQKQLDELANSSRFVAEIDGSFSKLEDRVFTPLDDLPNFKHVEDDGWFTSTKEQQKEIGGQVGVSKTGKWTLNLTDAEKKAIANQRGAFTVLHSEAVAAETPTLLLHDIAETWNFSYPNSLGGKTFAKLPKELQSALHEWKGASSGSALREWNKNAPAKIDELQDAFRQAGFHKRLSELADSDGLITVYRGEAVAAKQDDLVSVATNAAFAHQAFGGARGHKQTLKMKVHVDDIIAPVDWDHRITEGGLPIEFELIMRNNSKRIDVANELAQKRGFGQMSHKQMMHGWGHAQKQLSTANLDKLKQIQVHDRSSFGELDFAIEALRKADATGATFDVRSIIGGSEFVGTRTQLLEHLEFESLAKKFEFVQEQKLAQLAKEKLKVKMGTVLSDAQIAQAANLPFNYAFGKHPAVQVFDAHMPTVGGRMVSLKSFYKNMQEFKDSMRGLVSDGTLSEARATIDDFDMRGSSLRFDRDLTAKPAVLHYSGDRLQNRMGPDLLNTMLQTNKMALLDRLSNLDLAKSPLLRSIVDEILAIPDAYSMMTKPELLVGGTEGRHSKITTAAMGNRGNPTLTAADDVMGSVKRRFDKVVATKFAEHTAVFAELVSPSKRASLVSFAVAKDALRRGWDVTEMVAEGVGKNVLRLDPKSDRNAKLWEQQFGESFADVSAEMLYLPSRDANGRPVRVVVDDTAAAGLNSIQSLSHAYLDEVNPLRLEHGLKAVNKRAFHIPFYNMQDTNQVFILNAAGDVETVISGSTAKSAYETAQRNLAEMENARGFRGTLQTPDQMKENFSSAHLEWEPPTNFGISSKQTGGIKGRAATEIVQVDPDSVRQIVHQLQSNYDSVFRYTASTMFESELEFAARAKMASSIDEGLKKKGETVWDNYTRAILQKAALSKESALGAAYSGIETGLDRGLAALWDTTAKFRPHGTRQAAKVFGEYTRITGGEQPFMDIAEMIARTERVHSPVTSRQVFERFNRLATNVALRVLDFGMPVVNFASLLSTVPAVMKALRYDPANETKEAWQARVGAYGLNVGDDFVMPNPHRLATMAMHEVWQPEFQAAMKKASAKGMFDQEAAERIAFLTAPFETKSESARRKIIDKLSIATDWSEKMSRSISYAMGFSIGKRAMGLNDDAAMLFAHKMANSVIGDYRTMNKPQIFQGAVGMPFGLFTTWSWNLLQRVYGDLEGGRLGAVAMQGVLHQLYFGTEALPGSELFFGPLTTSYDGKTNIVDRLDEALGQDASTFLVSGGIASLTGIAVQARSDITTPALFSGAALSQKIPAIGVLSQWGQGVNDIYKSFKANSGFNGTQIAEAISVYGVNGFAKNVAQLGLGYSVDKSHNLITEDTRTMQNVLARAVELRTQTEHRKVLELRRDALQRAMYRDRVASLKDALITGLRSGEMTDERFATIMENYVRAGGTQAGMKELLRGAVLDAYVEKPMQMLIEKIKSNKDANGVMRLMYDYGDGLE